MEPDHQLVQGQSAIPVTGNRTTHINCQETTEQHSQTQTHQPTPQIAKQITHLTTIVEKQAARISQRSHYQYGTQQRTHHLQNITAKS